MVANTCSVKGACANTPSTSTAPLLTASCMGVSLRSLCHRTNSVQTLCFTKHCTALGPPNTAKWSMLLFSSYK